MKELEKKTEVQEMVMLQQDVHEVETLTEEIKLILARNQNKKFLSSLLTRALILEELIK